MEKEFTPFHELWEGFIFGDKYGKTKDFIH